MERATRIRRTAILCCHCLRNIAFYRAGWKHHRIVAARQFWINANANFLDIAVLEWCKLFAERGGKHHWARSIPDREEFATGLYAIVGMAPAAFLNYALGVKRYRDKFVAHLDEDSTMWPPRLRVARRCAAYLYDCLRRLPEAADCLRDANLSASEFYAVMYRHAREEYWRASGAPR